MHVEVTDIPNILSTYIEQHMIKNVLKSKIKNATGHAFALGSGSFLSRLQGEHLVTGEKFLKHAESFGIVSKDGIVDIERTTQALKAGVQSAGGKVSLTLYDLPILGSLDYSFDSEEVENIMKIAEEFAQ